MGCRQVARHRNLDPTFKGSNPFAITNKHKTHNYKSSLFEFVIVGFVFSKRSFGGSSTLQLNRIGHPEVINVGQFGFEHFFHRDDFFKGDVGIDHLVPFYLGLDDAFHKRIDFFVGGVF